MQRQTIQYSLCFKRQVIDDLENGRFDSIEQTRRHYGIGGTTTVQKWLRKYGKNHLIPKVILVQKPNEKNQINELKKQIKALENALGKTQVDNILNREFLNIACQHLGSSTEDFKKKHATTLYTKPK